MSNGCAGGRGKRPMRTHNKETPSSLVEYLMVAAMLRLGSKQWPWIPPFFPRHARPWYFWPSIHTAVLAIYPITYLQSTCMAHQFRQSLFGEADISTHMCGSVGCFLSRQTPPRDDIPILRSPTHNRYLRFLGCLLWGSKSGYGCRLQIRCGRVSGRSVSQACSMLIEIRRASKQPGLCDAV
ncbi:hypothetical protein FN846DRAFT_508802 [Sphaerosporella brunnea]|uniref:Uncharacterized protein n=1 Tax=Sphaerosporella brunnea TaxID=1250544 RepID=A0A5J5F3S4_9PEZI|nr:hypothetical protein FN846DRAFT_508802 [Sphaerosporella brunnea]